MTKNPFINALAALGYIIFVASLMWFGSKKDIDNSILGPIALLSLFSFSAAAMGYILLYQPFQLYFSNKKKEALDLFLKTLGLFGVITFSAMLLLFSGLI